MPKIYLACLDLGTTGCRTIIYTPDGDVAARAYQEYQSIFHSPTWIDHDPSTWISAAKETLQQAVSDLKQRQKTSLPRLAIAVTSQRATVTPVDAQGRPLDHAILWQDKRAIVQAQAIREQVGDAWIYHKTGLRIDPYFTLPNLLWLKAHRPRVFQETYKFLTVHDLIMCLLTGQFVTDWTQASRTMLFNINDLDWDEDICTRFEIPRAKLPQTVPPGTIVGEVLPGIAAELGIPANTPVVAVGGDQQAAAVGLGVIAPGLMCANTGTGSFVLAHAETPALDVQQRVLCSASAVEGKWVLDAGIFTTGSVCRWFRDQLGMLERQSAEQLQIDAYSVLSLKAEQSPPGADGLLFLPHFAGSAAPYWDPLAKGVLFGLTLSHTRAAVIRAMLEGIVLEISKNVRILSELVGEAREIRVSGGATRSPLFNRIQADVYGKPVVRGLSEESSSIGAAMVAAVSVGLYASLTEAAQHFVRVEHQRPIVPNADAQRVYQRLAVLHDDLYQALNTRHIYERAYSVSEK